MKILTFGWDFPPSRNGGLGVACHGLTRELIEQGAQIIFVLPRKQEVMGNNRFVFASEQRSVKVREVQSSLQPYHQAASLEEYIAGYDVLGKPIIRSRTIIEEARSFAHQASLIAKEEEFDIIHAHDWTSYLAEIGRASCRERVLQVV